MTFLPIVLIGVAAVIAAATCVLYYTADDHRERGDV